MGNAQLSVDDLPLPRRAAIAEILSEIVCTESELAELYAAFAKRPEPAPLKAAVSEMAQAKATRVPVIEALARVARDTMPDAAAAPRPEPAGIPEGRDLLFARLFGGERILETAYREVASLLGDPWRCPELPALAAQSARFRARLRDLYVRYS